MRYTSRFRWLAKFAVAVLVLASLAPTVSRTIANAAVDPVSSASLCSASGTGAPDRAPSDGPWMGLDCPLCLSHGLAPWAPTPDISPSTLILGLADVPPVPELWVPRARPVRLAAQPRAPPTLS